MEDHGVSTEKPPQYSKKSTLNLQNLTQQRLDHHQGHVEGRAAARIAVPLLLMAPLVLYVHRTPALTPPHTPRRPEHTEI